FDPEIAPRLAGIADADSVVVDGHKLLGTTMGHGAVLFKDEHALAAIAQTAEYIVRVGSADLGRTSVEGSRPFASFKTWLAMKALGREGLAALVARSIANARALARKIDAHAAFERTSALHSNIVTYRFVPPAWAPAIARCRAILAGVDGG